MNNDKYYEFNIQPKNEKAEFITYKIFSIIKTIFFALSIFLFIIALFTNFAWVLLLFSLIIALVSLFFQKRFYNFHDIIFVDGYLSIVKVVNNKRRKKLIRFAVSKINKIGFIGSSFYNSLVGDKNVKKIYAINTETFDDVYIHVKDSNETLLILPYDERLMYCLIKFIGNGKLEKEFIDKIKEN